MAKTAPRVTLGVSLCDVDLSIRAWDTRSPIGPIPGVVSDLLLSLSYSLCNLLRFNRASIFSLEISSSQDRDVANSHVHPACTLGDRSLPSLPSRIGEKCPRFQIFPSLFSSLPFFLIQQFLPIHLYTYVLCVCTVCYAEGRDMPALSLVKNAVLD